MKKQRKRKLQKKKPKSEVVENRIRVASAQFSGPLPPPSILSNYDQIVPGAAERIITMAEEQAKHRRKLEADVIKSDIVNSKRGILAGLIVVLGALTASVIISLKGQQIAGSIIGVGSLAGLAGVFVYGSQQRRKERERRLNNR